MCRCTKQKNKCIQIGFLVEMFDLKCPLGLKLILDISDYTFSLLKKKWNSSKIFIKIDSAGWFAPYLVGNPKAGFLATGPKNMYNTLQRHAHFTLNLKMGESPYISSASFYET